MEILGDDDAALPAPPRRRAHPESEQAVDVTPEDGDLTRDGDGDPAAPDPAPPTPGRFRLALDALTGPEALGLSGLAVALVAGTTTAFSPLMLLVRPDYLSGDSERPAPEVFGPVLGGFGALAVVLGLAGLFRLRTTSTGWARGVTGAATVLGVLLLLLAGWALWQADAVPPPEQTAG